jgi:hypothetical protein
MSVLGRPPDVEAAPETAPPRWSNWERVAAGAVLLIASIGMIVVGGAFLVGALGLVTNDFGQGPRPPLSPEESSLLWVLYGLAFACFAGAVVLAVLAVLGLGRILWGKWAASRPAAGG